MSYEHPLLPPGDALPIADIFRAHPALTDDLDNIVFGQILVDGNNVAHRFHSCYANKPAGETEDPQTIHLVDDQYLWCHSCFVGARGLRSQFKVTALIHCVLDSRLGVDTEDVNVFAAATTKVLHSMRPKSRSERSPTGASITGVYDRLFPYHHQRRSWPSENDNGRKRTLFVTIYGNGLELDNPLRTTVDSTVAHILRDGLHWTQTPDGDVHAVVRTVPHYLGAIAARNRYVSAVAVDNRITQPHEAQLLIDLVSSLKLEEAEEVVLATAYQ